MRREWKRVVGEKGGEEKSNGWKRGERGEERRRAEDGRWEENSRGIVEGRRGEDGMREERGGELSCCPFQFLYILYKYIV